MIHGTLAPDFAAVGAAFERCVTELGETGAAYHAMFGGHVVADLWTGKDFGPDSLAMVYSVTKPAAAFCVHLLADRGRLRLDDPVADHWPEFAQAGKDHVTVRQLLAHQAGLVALRRRQPAEVLLDYDRVCALLAAEPPWWEPGTAHGEHFLFYGHLCAELVRRVDGRSLGAFWREEVAEPWNLDFHIGLGRDELARVVDLEGTFPPPRNWLTHLAANNPPGMEDLAVVNGRAWRTTEVPGVNGHATARAVTRFFSGLAAKGELDGIRLASQATVAEMCTAAFTAPDKLFGHQVTRGLGVWCRPGGGFGMIGLGGSFVLADPSRELVQAYVTRHMGRLDRAGTMDAALAAALAQGSAV
jgi:CubicO group peptidase (beta-lactamase class C family)